ncbi:MULTISPECIES: hypothetical protein [unclassified Paludibacterium]|uniref:hypothetical protein n=1 Tax=unclassified Paludibacterium TaxID=2618429 RepID=UPI001C03F484|nr:hypothetical protein [Paludibacterium sp. B53371]BEV71357.1 hypothetical protein THUN1379_08390 [Paludibacterium sp. THUN1379]
MAAKYGNSPLSHFTNRRLPHRPLLPLFELVSELCPPREALAEPGLCRLIVDGRLDWSLARVNGQSWLYLPRAVPMRQLAGCTVLLAE